jgi:hypothetical protein
MTPDRWIFEPIEQARLAHVADSLHTGWLRYSEFAVRTPNGMRLRMGWDPRFEEHRPAAHEVEP